MVSKALDVCKYGMHAIVFMSMKRVHLGERVGMGVWHVVDNGQYTCEVEYT